MSREALSGSLARGCSMFLGLFTALNLFAAFRAGASWPDAWWLDVRVLGPSASSALLAVISVGLFMRSVRNDPPDLLGRATRLIIGTAIVITAFNSVLFYRLLVAGELQSWFPLPLSAFLSAALTWILVTGRREEGLKKNWPQTLSGFVLAAIVFPVLQIACYGASDYRRHCDSAVVFGALALADGEPSDILADRVSTAIEIYKAGLVTRLIFSGGPGRGTFTEPEAMRRMALRYGVPDRAITLDNGGINTEATVTNTARLLVGQRGGLLAVSHFYHLPRIKMEFERAGVEVFTVPSANRSWRHIPFNIPRETVAFWRYYVRWFGSGPGGDRAACAYELKRPRRATRGIIPASVFER